MDSSSTKRAAKSPRANALGRQELPGIRRMLDGLLAGVNARDGSICTRFYTRRYRESLMGAKDPRALVKCRKAAREAEIQASLVRIERLNIRRSSGGALVGHVQLVERIGTGVLLRVRFGIVRTAGDYRIDSGRGEQIVKPPRPTTGS